MTVENKIWDNSINGVGKISLVWFGDTPGASTKGVAPVDETTDRSLLPVPGHAPNLTYGYNIEEKTIKGAQKSLQMWTPAEAILSLCFFILQQSCPAIQCQPWGKICADMHLHTHKAFSVLSPHLSHESLISDTSLSVTRL